MPDLNPLSWWRRLLSLPNTSRTKTLLVAFMVSTVCAAAVSFSTVLLRPLQQAHLSAQRQSSVQQILTSLPGMAELLHDAGVETMETRLVDLNQADFAVGLEADDYDFRAAMSDPDLSIELIEADDLARIGRRPKLVPVHFLRNRGELVLIVLPVYGRGYQSTIHALLALNSDLRTVAALQIVEQAETPGLGTRITAAAWQAQWTGKQTTDSDGVLRIAVVAGAGSSSFEVDAVSGATRSSIGVGNLVRFWLGAQGYGPFLRRLADGEI